jgi:phenylalanyl-tRNA synthetase beta chain
MNISLNWLQDFIKITESPEALAHRLTMSGLEVEAWHRVEKIKGGWQGVVIGEVVACEKHPDADRLSLTTVDVGSEKLPIVCGAPNVAKGQKVAVATIGTVLHTTNGETFEIKKSKIRGEVSLGMLCAEDELGLGTSHEGIMVLDTAMPNGTPLKEIFNNEDDVVFEIGLTPNRADAASHLGVARDLKALYNKPLCTPEVASFKTGNDAPPVQVSIENTKACPRYCGITISGIEVGASPDWLQNRLRAVGQAPINNIVDITNYVMYELGQPLHAFDADKIAGRRVTVKTLPAGTSFITLDEEKHDLHADDLMICDDEGGMCIAGVFGGLHSGVTNNTTTIFLESAYFNPDFVRKTVQRHDLKTESAFRFERGTDPEITLYALQRAALLIQELAGGRLTSAPIDVYPEKINAWEVSVRYDYLNTLIGKNIEHNTIHTILESLDIAIKHDENGFIALVPPYRVDVKRPADIAEEVLRIYGYDRIEPVPHMSSRYLAAFPVVDKDREVMRAKELLVADGFSEISTNSLTRPAYAHNITGFQADASVEIINKLSEELGCMRQSMLFSGLEVVAHNVKRRQRDLKLFEFGKSYQKKDGNYEEQEWLALWMTGKAHSESWMMPSADLQFHDLYGVVQKIISKFTSDVQRAARTENAIFEDGLNIFIADRCVAKLGVLAQSSLKAVELNQPVLYAEVDLPVLMAGRGKTFTVEEISKYPEVRRDLSLVLDKAVTFQDIADIIQKKEFGGILKKVNVFDYYVGEKIENDKKAYALSFILQDENKTLTDKAIDKIMSRLMEIFENQLGAIIRK